MNRDLFWKRFAGLGTGSDHNVFLWARLKLTAVYVLILGLVLVGFSLTLYQSLNNSLNTTNDDDFVAAETHQIFIHDTLESVRNRIILIDIIVLLLAAGASYALAGYTLQPIQRSLEAQRKFSENASHELRTPLAVMKNDIEVLLRNPNPSKESTHTTLQSNIEEINRMSKMTKDLLMLARSEKGVAEHTEKINVSVVIKNIAEKMKLISKHTNVRISIATKTELYIQGDMIAFERIILNLMQNAIDHTENGSITIALRQEKQSVVITISDTGSGIKAKDLPYIFDRFYKGQGTSGSGLGLSIVKELVAYHGGSISIMSDLGKGTEVLLRLPLSA